jgi:hypothetical protein
MKKKITRFFPIVFFILLAIFLTSLKPSRQEDKPNAGLATPAGFKAVKLVENLGVARHLIVTPKGNICQARKAGKRKRHFAFKGKQRTS